MNDFWKGFLAGLFLSVMGFIGLSDYQPKSKEQKKYLKGACIGIITGVLLILSITLPIALNS